MKTLASGIGIYHGNKAALLAESVMYYLNVVHNIDAHITDIGSGDTTGVSINGEVFECNYVYTYTDEKVTGVTLQCDDAPVLQAGVTVKFDIDMCEIYKEIMLATRLINECTKGVFLSDEAMAHPENWDDAI